MVQLIKTRPLTDGTGYFGHVIVNGQSINDAVIQAGHAYKRPMMDKSGGQQSNPKPFSNPPSLLGAPGTPPLTGAGDGNPMMNKPQAQPLMDMPGFQPGPAMMGNAMFGGRERNTRSPNDAGGNRQMKQMSPRLVWQIVKHHGNYFYSPALKKGGYTGFTLSFRNSVILS